MCSFPLQKHSKKPASKRVTRYSISAAARKLFPGRGHTNIVPVFTEDGTGLEGKSLDAILVYDVFHELEEPKKNLKEWNRILRDDGALSLNDPHLKEAEILSKVLQGNYFKLDKKGNRTYTFRKIKRT